MRNSLDDVVTAAMRVLDEVGFEGCSMRRVAASLSVQPSALYHHVENKQSLLALMANQIVTTVDGSSAREVCTNLHQALMSVRDGAEVVATALAFRLGGTHLEGALTRYVGEDGAQTLLFYTLAHTQATQTREQAVSLGAQIASDHREDDRAGSFMRGLEIILRGIGE